MQRVECFATGLSCGSTTVIITSCCVDNLSYQSADSHTLRQLLLVPQDGYHKVSGETMRLGAVRSNPMHCLHGREGHDTDKRSATELKRINRPCDRPAA
jgi:hypothetical protein